MVYNGISFQNFNGTIDQGQVKASCNIGPMDPTVLYVGRMTAQKGPDLLVEAIPFILRYHPGASSFCRAKGTCALRLKTGPGSLAWPMRAGSTAACARRLIDLYKACDACAFPAVTSPSASWCSRPGLRANPSWPPITAGPRSLFGMTSMDTRFGPNPSRLPGASGRSFVISSMGGGWEETAALRRKRRFPGTRSRAIPMACIFLEE